MKTGSRIIDKRWGQMNYPRIYNNRHILEFTGHLTKLN